MKKFIAEFIAEHDKYQYIDLTDKQLAKLAGAPPEAGSKVKISWRGWGRGDYDEGYLFAIPWYDRSVYDYFVHIPNPENPGGKDSCGDEFIHLMKLLKNPNCKKVEIL